jgi:hypothetical protein
VRRTSSRLTHNINRVLSEEVDGRAPVPRSGVNSETSDRLFDPAETEIETESLRLKLRLKLKLKLVYRQSSSFAGNLESRNRVVIGTRGSGPTKCIFFSSMPRQKSETPAPAKPLQTKQHTFGHGSLRPCASSCVLSHPKIECTITRRLPERLGASTPTRRMPRSSCR